jgi:hypothetical protein
LAISGRQQVPTIVTGNCTLNYSSGPPRAAQFYRRELLGASGIIRFHQNAPRGATLAFEMASQRHGTGLA